MSKSAEQVLESHLCLVERMERVRAKSGRVVRHLMRTHNTNEQPPLTEMLDAIQALIAAARALSADVAQLQPPRRKPTADLPRTMFSLSDDEF